MSIKLNGNNIAGYVKDKNLKESIIPESTDNLDLGSADKYFKNAYINNLLLGNNTLKSDGTNITLTNDDNEYTLYHTGNKPSALDVGAVPLSGNTKDSPITGNVYIQNYVKWIDSTNNKEINMIGFNETSKEAIYGGGNNTGGVTFDTAGGSDSIKVWDAVNGKSYKVYHTGNVPKTLWTNGDKTAESGTEAPNPGYMCMNTIYNNGYPFSYGNLLTLSGSGKSELAMQWTNDSTPSTGRLYYRSKRDVSEIAWGDWKKIAYTDDILNKAYTAGTLDHCARSADTGNTNTNKYFKLASFTISDNYGSASAEYSIGFNGHGQSTSPHHKIGVWIKRQDSTFSMDLKVWGAINDSYAKYVLVKTGTYQATLYAFITAQYCTLYMSCISRMFNSASVEYFSGTTPITSIGDIQSWGSYMDKPSIIGANTTVFAGIISNSAISENLINMNTCVDNSGIITLSNNAVYRVSGMVHNKKNLYLYNKSNTSQKYTLLNMSGITLGSNDYIPYNRTFKINTASTWFLADENQARPDWTQITIEKISGGN